MLTWQVKERLSNLMMDTGKGSKPVLFLTEEGDIFSIDKIEYDSENETFFIYGKLDENVIPGSSSAES